MPEIFREMELAGCTPDRRAREILTDASVILQQKGWSVFSLYTLSLYALPLFVCSALCLLSLYSAALPFSVLSSLPCCSLSLCAQLLSFSALSLSLLNSSLFVCYLSLSSLCSLCSAALSLSPPGNSPPLSLFCSLSH